MNNGHSYANSQNRDSSSALTWEKQEPWMTPARFSTLFAVAVLNTLDYTEIG